MSFVPASVIICSGAFRKLSLIWFKISIEDLPGYFRIFTWCFHPCQVSIVSSMTSIFDSISGLALLIWFFDFSLLRLFDFTDVLFPLVIATCSIIGFTLFILWALSDVVLVKIWFIEVLLVFSSQLFDWFVFV